MRHKFCCRRALECEEMTEHQIVKQYLSDTITIFQNSEKKYYEYKNDEETFSEMRSNLLLVSSNHYSKKAASFFNKVRNSQKINDNQKLRITKNHIHKTIDK